MNHEHEDARLLLSDHALAPSPFGDLTVPFGDLGGRAATDTRKSADQGGELLVGALRVRLGDKPVAYDLRQLYMSAHGDPPDTPAFNDYDIWLIVHAFGVIREQGSAAVEAMGYEAVFSDDRAVYTIDLLPQTEFVTAMSGALEARVDLGLEGRAALPQPDLPLVADAPTLLRGSASLALSQSAKLLGRLSFSVMTPTVLAVGKGSSRCQWHFEKRDRPLLGDQIMVQTALVHRRTRKLDLKIRGYAMVRPRTLSFAARRETEWITVSCPLISASTESP